MKGIPRWPLAVVVAAMLVLPIASHALPTFVAAADVSAPTDGLQIHTAPFCLGGYVTCTTVGQYIEISGATSWQYFSLDWDMHLEIDGSTQDRDNQVRVIQCDQYGYFHHDANGTGSLSKVMNMSWGQHTSAAWTDLIDNNDAAHNRNASHTHTFTLIW